MDNPFLRQLSDTSSQLVNLAQNLRAAAQQRSEFNRTMNLQQSEQDIQRAREARMGKQESLQNQLNVFSQGGQPVSDSGSYQSMTDVPRFGSDESGNLTPAGAGVTQQADPSRIVTAAGKPYYMPTQEEQGSLQARLAGVKTRAEAEAKMLPLTGRLAQAAGVKEGTMVPEAGYNAAVSRIAAADERAETARNKPQKNFIFDKHTDDKGTVTYTKQDPDSGEVTVVKKIPGIGQTKVKGAGDMTPGQKAVESRFNQREQDAGRQEHDLYQQKEQEQWDLKGQFGSLADATAYPDGSTVVDPRKGQEMSMNAGLRKYFVDQAKRAGEQAQSWQSRAKGVRKRFGWGEFEPRDPNAPAVAAAEPGAAAPASTAPPAAAAAAPAGSPSAGAPAAAPAAGAPPPSQAPAPKVATMAHIRAFAAANKMTVSQAVAQAEREKFAIAGQ